MRVQLRAFGEHTDIQCSILNPFKKTERPPGTGKPFDIDLKQIQRLFARQCCRAAYNLGKLGSNSCLACLVVRKF
jgi:hypothetical protein